MMSAIRWILGKLILFLNAAFPARPRLQRTPEQQASADAATRDLALYQFEACPFCVKVRRAIKRLGLRIEYRDAHKNDAYAEELVKGGGELQVPCLRIQNPDGSVRWMYESSEIIRYLNDSFNPPADFSRPRP